MARIKLLKPYAGKDVGEFLEVKNNEAHTLIVKGIATLNYKNKMMKPRQYKRAVLTTKQYGSTRKSRTRRFK